MNKFITSDNGGLPIQLDDFRFIDDSVRNALFGVMSAYGIAADESFILSGAGSTLNGGNFDIAAGYISLNGEILEVEAHSITTTLGGGEFHVWKLLTANDPAGLKTFESTISFDTYEVRQAEVVVEVPVGVFMPMLAPTLIDRISGFFGTIPQTTIIEIGVWDMDADDTVLVAHGLADITKIRSAEVVVFDDLELTVHTTNKLNSPAAAATQLGINVIDGSNVQIKRADGGDFDNTLFDDGVINRGYITIQHIS